MSVQYVSNPTYDRTLMSAIKDEKTTISHKSNTTIRELFKRKKATRDKLQMDNLVYELSCNGKERETCDKVYVGTTKRKLCVRIAEHEADVKKGRESTALAKHAKETGHNINFKGVKILDREKRENKRYTLESLRIQQRLTRSMNTKEDKDDTNLQYSVAIV